MRRAVLNRMKTDIERRAGSGKSTLTFQNPSAQLYSAMAQLSPLTQYAELYVDSSRPSIQQAASVDAVAYLLKNDILTLEALVEEMGMYLPTTDNLIHARDGLADWRALKPKPTFTIMLRMQLKSGEKEPELSSDLQEDNTESLDNVDDENADGYGYFSEFEKGTA
uniref:Uncharacterized protein n=1 Tax=Vitis vinifera TaxID=29760 RepID=A5BE17_VITVI|nr:hypothetical protein VITISV_011189 [Vitis vinifera]